MAEAALVATTSAKPVHTPKYKRLTDLDKAFALRYQAEGLTQVEIAQRLACDQGTVSRWLSQCQDTTAEATTYFRGRALPMAEKIVKRGRPSDLIKALQGVGVLEQDQKSGLVVNVGGNAIVNFGPLSPPTITKDKRKSTESLTITTGSDNRSSVNSE